MRTALGSFRSGAFNTGSAMGSVAQYMFNLLWVCLSAFWGTISRILKVCDSKEVKNQRPRSLRCLELTNLILQSISSFTSLWWGGTSAEFMPHPGGGAVSSGWEGRGKHRIWLHFGLQSNVLRAHVFLKT